MASRADCVALRTGARRALLVLLGALALACGATAQRAGALVRPGVYLALGDSLAVGVGASTPGDAYVPRVFAFLHSQRRLRVDRLVNLGAVGETTSSFLGGQLTAALDEIDYSTIAVRYITIDIGVDDLFLNPICSSDPASSSCPIQANLTTILSTLKRELRAQRETPRIALLAYYNPYSGTSDPRAPAADLALLGTDGKLDCAPTGAAIGLNDIIACTARKYGATVANAYPPFEGKAPELVNPGDIHPNDAGYAVIARRFGRALTERKRSAS